MIKIKKNLTAGLFSVIPLWVTWLVLAFIIGLAIDLVGPPTRWLVKTLRPSFPNVAHILDLQLVQHAISILLLLIILYCLGWLTTHFIGRQFIKLFDRALQKIPLIGKVYFGTKQIIEAFQAKPDHAKQVVLIEYPHPGMKTIGLVTKSLTDRKTQESILAVYVPTTPNPTSGFLEIVPAENVKPVDWSVNEAITFIVSGGSIGPQVLDYSITSEDKLSGKPNNGNS